MSDMAAWMGTSVPDANWQAGADRAAFTAQMIAQKPSSITVKRYNRAQDVTQTVRIDVVSNIPRGVDGQNANPSTMRVLVLGYKDHPTASDTDLRRKDRFLHDGIEYEVTQIMPSTPYQLQAIAEAVER